MWRGWGVLVTVGLLAVPALSAPTKKPSPAPDLALINAVQGVDAARVRRVLATGANPNARDRSGVTALMFAAGMGDVEICRLLLGSKASVHAKAPDGRTALHLGFYKADVVQLLVERGADAKAVSDLGHTLPHLRSSGVSRTSSAWCWIKAPTRTVRTKRESRR